MARVVLRENRLSVGRFSLGLERTLRVPSEGGPYPLPPTFGQFPIRRFRRSYLVGMHAWEALWLSFEGAAWKPNAVQVSSGGINVLTGEAQGGPLSTNPQNYLVAPLQLWLDGFKTATSVVSQFVATPLEQGTTVGEQLGGKGSGLEIRVMEPKAGLFPDRVPRNFNSYEFAQEGMLGLAAGGAIEQKIYPDPYGIETWDQDSHTCVRIQVLDEAGFRERTGLSLAPSPISAAEYIRLGYPWFRLADELKLDITATEALRSLQKI